MPPIIMAAAFAAFLATFNETFLNVAFTPIMVYFGIGVTTVQWLATGYLLVAAVMITTAAFAFHRFPTRPLFLMTVAFLVAGSVIGALAPSFVVLLAGRVVQAMGTGLLIPIGMDITLAVAPREKLGAYLGVMGAMTTLGPSLAIIISGSLLEIASWRSLLWVFAGLSALCFLVGALVVRTVAGLGRPRLDLGSVALVGIGLVGVLYGISTVFTGTVIVSLIAIAVGILMLTLFFFRQNRSHHPLISMAPLRVTVFTMGVLLDGLVLITLFAMNILIPIHLQSELGFSSLSAAVALFPAIILGCIAALFAGRFYDRHGPRLLIPAGILLIAVFAVVLGVVVPLGSLLGAVLCYVPIQLGSAMVVGPVQSFALSKLPNNLHAHGVTILSMVFQIGGCIGSAASTGLYGLGSASAMGPRGGFLMVGIGLGAIGVIGLLIAIRITRPATKISVAGAEEFSMGDLEESLLSRLMKRDVWSLPVDATIGEATRLFVERSISGAPIVSADGRVLGFISDGNVAAALGDRVPAFKTPYSFLAEKNSDEFFHDVATVLAQPALSIASRDVITVDIDDDLGEVTALLAARHVKKVPVMSGERMIGVINRSDINRYLISTYLEETPQESVAG